MRLYAITVTMIFEIIGREFDQSPLIFVRRGE